MSTTDIVDAALAITVSAPAAGDTWTQGQSYSATWASSGVSSPLRIFATKAGVEVTPTIATAAEPSGTRSIAVPNSWVPGSDYKVCATASSGMVSGCSGFFAVKGAWNCDGKVDLIDSAQLSWQTNPTSSGSYTSTFYTRATPVGPSNPYTTNPPMSYADQIATAYLSNLAASPLWVCVEYEIVSAPAMVGVEIHVASAPPESPMSILGGYTTHPVGHYTECVPGSATRAFTGWQFALQIWTPDVTYQLDRAAVCQQ